MKCEQFYFYDESIEGCISCAELCNPYRQATELECQIHCSGYLHWRNEFTTPDDQKLSLTSQIHFSSMTMVLLVCGSLGLLTFICSISVIYALRRRLPKKKHSVEKSVETKVEFLHVDEVQRSLYSPSKFIPSSLCQESDSLSDAKAPDIFIEKSPTSIRTDAIVFIELPPRSIVFSSMSIDISQETSAECSHMPLTQAKETGSTSVAIQHQVESIRPLIDLHEDFDCIEQAYDLVERGHGSDDVVCNFSCDDIGKRNLRITAILQRLRWVNQFWWDVEGAKVVVDASRRSTAKNDIRNVLQCEGIPSSEFDFQLVSPQPILCHFSGSVDSELNS